MLSSQLIAAYTRRTGNKVSPLAQSMAAAALGIADPVLNKLVSPEALSELLSVGWPVSVVPATRSHAWCVGVSAPHARRISRRVVIPLLPIVLPPISRRVDFENTCSPHRRIHR